MSASAEFAGEAGRPPVTGNETTHVSAVGLAARVFALSMTLFSAVFLLNNVLIYWYGWPGVDGLFAHYQWFGVEPLREPLESASLGQGWFQLAFYLAAVALAAAYVMTSTTRCLRVDAARLGALAAYIVRASFWAVMLVGLVDMIISMLRVEELLVAVVGQELTTQLGRPEYRGHNVHYPLILFSFVIALFVRRLDVVWLAVLVVFAEFQIVIFRFIFSYEQAFMADLVRFWYAALFLFASAYALVEDGHVRVDVLYAHFSKRAKAWANTAGVLLLGLPLCWVILVEGMSGKGASIISPLLSFEISQSGFGMYTKYLMAAFLIVFAVSMIVQFTALLLESIADLRDEPGGRAYDPDHAHETEI